MLVQYYACSLLTWNCLLLHVAYQAYLALQHGGVRALGDHTAIAKEIVIVQNSRGVYQEMLVSKHIYCLGCCAHFVTL